jgi:Uma2 family endonuclease
MAASSLTTLSQESLLERWKHIIADPEFIRYHGIIETDAQGTLLMSPPPDGDHQKRNARIWALLERLLPGDGAVTERAVLTDQGIKVPDVIWLTPSRAREISGTKPIAPAPEICVEVCSPSNSLEELTEKRVAYFHAGAREVWICDQSNNIEFFGPKGQMAKSTICPRFPNRIDPYPNQAKARRKSERARENTPQGPGRAPETSERPEPPER